MPYNSSEKQKEWRDKNKQYIENYRKGKKIYGTARETKTIS